MRGRGFAHWGVFPWGFGESEASAEERPQIIYKSPIPGQNNVVESAPIHVQFYHPLFTLVPESMELKMNGLVVYDGDTGFKNGARGSVRTLSGVTSIVLYPAQGFEYGQLSSVTAAISDQAENTVQETWSFVARDDPSGYVGADALPVEIRMQKPYPQFMALDWLRQEMLNHAIGERSLYIVNRGNKAARVIYQAAFATELCTLQNIFRIKNPGALLSVVREKQTLLALDVELAKHRDALHAAITDFGQQRIFTDDYLNSFRTQAESPSYLYRVSLVSNLVLYGAAYELRQRV